MYAWRNKMFLYRPSERAVAKVNGVANEQLVRVARFRSPQVTHAQTRQRKSALHSSISEAKFACFLVFLSLSSAPAVFLAGRSGGSYSRFYTVSL